METERKRRESTSSNMSLESMSLSSGGNNDDSFELVTNSSYLNSKKAKVLRDLGETAQVTPPLSLSEHSPNFSPITPRNMFPDFSPDNNIDTTGILSQYSEEVTSMLKALHLIPQPERLKDPEHWFHRLCPFVASMIKECPTNQRSRLQDRLKRHLYRRAGGGLFVGLVAASYLRIHPDYHEVRCKKDALPKHLPSPLREKLSRGEFVPIRHILYGEALVLGFARHITNTIEVDAEPYPLDLMKESPPSRFVSDIRRPDIFRGLSTHSLILSAAFPRLAARMHNLFRHMWILVYQEGWDVQTAMNLYDNYFMEFEKHLCSLAFLSMDSFPIYLIDSVRENCTAK